MTSFHGLDVRTLKMFPSVLLLPVYIGVLRKLLLCQAPPTSSRSSTLQSSCVSHVLAGLDVLSLFTLFAATRAPRRRVSLESLANETIRKTNKDQTKNTQRLNKELRKTETLERTTQGNKRTYPQDAHAMILVRRVVLNSRTSPIPAGPHLLNSPPTRGASATLETGSGISLGLQIPFKERYPCGCIS